MVIMVILVRITPAKWDPERSWLNHEDRAKVIGAGPKAKMTGCGFGSGLRKMGRPSKVGMALQMLGIVLLGMLALGGQALLLLPIVVILSGEIIYISSLDHVGERSPEEGAR
jgi:hypothetical protein